MFMLNPVTSYRAIVNGAVDVIPQGINAIAHSGGEVTQGGHAIGDVFTRFFAGKANAAAAAKQAAAVDAQAAELAKHLTVSGDDAKNLARQIIQQQHGGAGVAANGGQFQGHIQGTYGAAGGHTANNTVGAGPMGFMQDMMQQRMNIQQQLMDVKFQKMAHKMQGQFMKPYKTLRNKLETFFVNNPKAYRNPFGQQMFEQMQHAHGQWNGHKTALDGLPKSKDLKAYGKMIKDSFKF